MADAGTPNGKRKRKRKYGDFAAYVPEHLPPAEEAKRRLRKIRRKLQKRRDLESPPSADPNSAPPKSP